SHGRCRSDTRSTHARRTVDPVRLLAVAGLVAVLVYFATSDRRAATPVRLDPVPSAGPEYVAADVPRLAARTARADAAPEPDQGIAANADYFYAVDSETLARYAISFSNVIAFDSDWRRTAAWVFPSTVLDRLAPHAAPGGAIGPDGWLYLLGHERPEMYV